MTVYVGVDNGISGGICAISPTSGAGIVCMTPMPIQKTRKGAEVDIVAGEKGRWVIAD